MGLYSWQIHYHCSADYILPTLQYVESGAEVALVFFDLRKAFDSVPDLPLLQKLREIGLNAHILQWITTAE